MGRRKPWHSYHWVGTSVSVWQKEGWRGRHKDGDNSDQCVDKNMWRQFLPSSTPLASAIAAETHSDSHGLQGIDVTANKLLTWSVAHEGRRKTRRGIMQVSLFLVCFKVNSHSAELWFGIA